MGCRGSCRKQCSWRCLAVGCLSHWCQTLGGAQTCSGPKGSGRLTIDWLVLEGYGFSVQAWWFLFVFVGTSVVKGCITPHSCSVLPSNPPSKPEPQTASEVSGRIGPHEQRGQPSVSQCLSWVFVLKPSLCCWCCGTRRVGIEGISQRVFSSTFSAHSHNLAPNKQKTRRTEISTT